MATIKSATGIAGFDCITGGGTPQGRNTLVVGAPGAGKTMFAMQILVHGATHLDEPGLFLSFEERPEDLCSNADGFGWNLKDLIASDKLVFLDGRLSGSISGRFDITGLLAGLSARAAVIGARRVVLDGLDVLLSALADPQEEMRQILEIDRWLRESGMTGIITGKLGDAAMSLRYEAVQHVVDCVVSLEMRIENRVASRDLRVLKYRGSDCPGHRYSMVITDRGIDVLSDGSAELNHKVFDEKVSSGIARLDAMLGGGHFRGSSILISGAPGTAKTTLASAMADATCSAGERVVFLSFDEAADQIARNLKSVGIDLNKHLQSGALRMMGMRAAAASAEANVYRLRRIIDEHQPHLVVIDPVSALIKGGGKLVADAVVQGILDFAKSRGITSVLTSLVDSDNPERETTDTHISTMADTWLHLCYVAHGGERNRALTIIKSRGTAHSNQVRELVLSSSGLTLSDVYSAGGAVLMGTARLEREAEAEAEAAGKLQDFKRQQQHASARIAEKEAHLLALQAELSAARADLEMLEDETRRDGERSHLRRNAVLAKRLADTEPVGGGS